MYDDIAPSYNILHGDEQERKLKKLLQNIDLDEYQEVVDVGCGTAHLAEFFSEIEYFGIDPSKELLKQAPTGTNIQVANGQEIPVPDHAADLVLSLTALHNYEKPLVGVDELARICKKTALIGVLKKSSSHDEIVSRIRKQFDVKHVFLDAHDTLFVANRRNV